MSLALVAIAAARPEGKNRYYGGSGYARYLGRSLTSTSDPSSTADPYQMDKEEEQDENRFYRLGYGYGLGYPYPYGAYGYPASTYRLSSTTDPYQMYKEEVGNESRSRYGRGYYPMSYYMPPYPEPFGYPLLEFTPYPAPPVNGAADGADTHPATATATASPSPTEN